MSAGTFHCSVRNDPLRRIASARRGRGGSAPLQRPKGLHTQFFHKQREEKASYKNYPLTISTGRLNSLRNFHRPPIFCKAELLPLDRILLWRNLVIYKGSSSRLAADSRSYLGACFPLRCFQRLSERNLATQRCPLSWNN